MVPENRQYPMRVVKSGALLGPLYNLIGPVHFHSSNLTLIPRRDASNALGSL